MRPLAVIGLLAVASLVSPAAGAQPVRACPPGQAVQALDPGGKVATCIPVPAPVDLGAVNAAISAEAAARAAGDQNLNGRVDAEAVARMAADDDLRAGLSEGGLSGRYAVVGTGNCSRASQGFLALPEFVPNAVPGAVIQPQVFTYTGVRTFSAGTMQGMSTVYSITYPALVVSGGFNTGAGSVVEISQDWVYVLGADRTLTITGTGAHGRTIQGAGVGSIIETTGAPSLAGKVSKDWRTIVLTNAAMQVEHSISTSTSGVVNDVPRICVRTETMTKMAD